MRALHHSRARCAKGQIKAVYAQIAGGCAYFAVPPRLRIFMLPLRLGSGCVAARGTRAAAGERCDQRSMLLVDTKRVFEMGVVVVAGSPTGALQWNSFGE